MDDIHAIFEQLSSLSAQLKHAIDNQNWEGVRAFANTQPTLLHELAHRCGDLSGAYAQLQQEHQNCLQPGQEAGEESISTEPEHADTTA